MNDDKLYLVAGATGKIGRLVVRELLERDQRVRVLTRKPGRTEFPAQVEVFAGDLTRPETLSGAFKGVFGVHFISFGDENYSPLRTGQELVHLAEREGVRRATVLWNGEGQKGTLEPAVKASRFEWTILEPQEYMSNVLNWRASIVEQGMVKEPFAERKTAALHDGDLAAAISTLLTSGGHAGRTFTLTGPEVLTPRMQVGEISSAIGREIEFVELNEEQTRKRWEAWGIPEATRDYLYEWYRNPPLEGYTVTTAVQDITGKPARTFKQWVARHKSSFV